MALQSVASVGSGATSGSAFTLALTGWSAQHSSGVTAPAAGDLVIITGQVETTTAGTWSQTGGAACTIVSAGDLNTTLGGNLTFVAWRIFDGSETGNAPAFTCTQTGRWQYGGVCVRADPGFIPSIDTWATVLTDTVSGTTHTANAATAAGAGETSVILHQLVATAVGTTAITQTVESGWTSVGTRSQAGTVSTYSQFVAFSDRSGQSGTVTPAVYTTGVATVANFYHALVRQFPGPRPVTQGLLSRPQPARALAPQVITGPAPSGATTATATLAGAGSVTAVVTEIAPATLTGAGSVTAVVTEIAGATAAGAGAVNGLVTLPGGGTITGSGSVGTAVTQGVIASPAGAGSVTDVVTLICIAALTGAGAVNANAASSGSTAALAAGGHVSALAAQQAPAVLAAAGALSASGAITGTASLTGAGHVTAAAAQGATGSAAAAAALTALVTQPVTAGPSGAGTVTAVGGSTAAFTVGVLTAADAPGSVLTASGAAGTLTAGTAATAALTAAGNPLAILTAADAPGAAVAGLLDETAAAVLDEAGGFILAEDGT